MRIKEYKKIILSCILLIIFTVMVNYQSIVKKLQPIESYGTYIKTEGGFLIRDSSTEWHGGKTTQLNSPFVILKKEFFINEDISNIKEVRLWLKLGAKKTGKLIIKVNENEFSKIPCKEFFFPGGIPAEGLVGSVRIGPIPLSLLKSGLNTFTLQVIEEASISIPIDDVYNYGRSLVSFDGEGSWEKVKGEYMMELEIKTK